MTNAQPHGADTTSLRQDLEQIAGQLPEEGLAVAELVNTLGREGLLLLAVILCLPFLLPVSIPGVSTVFGALILLIGIAVLFNAKPWLPARIAQYKLARERLQSILTMGAHWVARLERISRPRLMALVTGPMHNFNGAMLALGAALLMIPLAVVPFSNTLPALAIIFTAVGLIQRDGGCALIGLGFNVLAIIYFGFIFTAGTAAVMHAIQNWLPFLL
jgi:hypothetical protein